MAERTSLTTDEVENAKGKIPSGDKLPLHPANGQMFYQDIIAKKLMIYNQDTDTWQPVTGATDCDFMTKSIYDINDNGIVDDSENLNGNPGSYYLDRANHTGPYPYLDDITDVTLITPTQNDALVFDGTNWINNPLPPVGDGDMKKSVYDTNANDIVDNSENLNNNPGSYYLSRLNHTDTQPASTISDFDIEVENNSAVVLNTEHRAKRNNPHRTRLLTLTDTLINRHPKDGDFIQYDLALKRWRNKQIEFGNDRIVNDRQTLTLETGKYFHVCRLTEFVQASMQITCDSDFYAPAVNLNIMHVYGEPQYELGITGFQSAPAQQFGRFIVTRATPNSAPVDVYF